MKAMVYRKYGSVDNLHLEEVDKPAPKGNQVLVKVYAASVNSWDYDLVRGQPVLVRLSGPFKPKINVLGADVAGRVAAIGDDVGRFNVGDMVFGDLSACGWGGFAEYVCAPETALTSAPRNVSLEEAAAVPQAGVMALQGLCDIGRTRPGEKVLVNGAAGGVGTFALQLAKYFGAEVTAVDHTEKLETLKSLGADHVIDYTKENFTRNGKQYDRILDVVAHRPIFDYRRALKPDGVYIMIGGTTSTLLQFATLGKLLSKTGGKQLRILMHEANKDLTYLQKLVESRKITPVIDGFFNLPDTPEAIRRLGSGKARGKVVIRVTPTAASEKSW